MAPQRLSPWTCARVTLGYGLVILISLAELTAGGRNCSHPIMPEHVGFRCSPSPCSGFPLKTSIHYFCEPGYAIPERVHTSRCHRGHWVPPVPTCKPLKDGSVNSNERVTHSLPSVATTAVGVSIFLLTTTACMVIKSRLFPCHSHSRRSCDQMDLMVDGLPIPLPSYEEAVYGSWGQRLPPCRGPTQLLLAQDTPGHDPSPPHSQSDPRLIHPANQSPGQAPPPYEEVQSQTGEGGSDTGVGRDLRVALSNDKDV